MSEGQSPGQGYDGRHDFAIRSKKTKVIAGGKTALLVVTLKKGKAAYKCTVPGHAAAGMKGTLKVT